MACQYHKGKYGYDHPAAEKCWNFYGCEHIHAHVDGDAAVDATFWEAKERIRVHKYYECLRNSFMLGILIFS